MALEKGHAGGRAEYRHWSAAVLLVALLAAYPMIWNGFPLVFDDSNIYIRNIIVPGVPPFYSLFVQISALRTDLFLTVIFQALCVASVLILSLKRMGAAPRPWIAVLLAACILLLTQLPWLASWIMPDFLAGLGGVCLLDLLLAPQALARGEILYFSFVVVLGAISASANIPIYLGLALVCVVLQLVLHGFKTPLPRLVAAAASLICAVVLILSANLLIFHRAVINSNSAILMFSRYADIGVAQPYLAERCRSHHFAICDHQDELAHATRGKQNFLWDGLAADAMKKPGFWEEYSRLDSEILYARLETLVREGWADTVTMFLHPTLGEPQAKELTSHAAPPEDYLHATVAEVYPRDRVPFAGDLQERGILIREFPKTFFMLSTYASYAALLVLSFMALSRKRHVAAVFGLSVVALILGELMLHGFLVGAFPRYHVKVSWTAWLAVVVLAMDLFSRRDADRGSSRRPDPAIPELSSAQGV